MTQVRVITKKKEMALIQYKEDDRYWRSWVPLTIIKSEGDKTLVNNPSTGIPYGEDFSYFLITQGLTEEVAIKIDTALKSRGVWTWPDVLAHSDLVISAYSEAMRITAQPLFTEAVRNSKQEI